MNMYIDSIEEVLHEIGIKYQINEKRNIIEIPFRTVDNNKIDILFFTDDHVKYIKIFIPLLAAFPYKKPGKLISIINKYNMKLIFGGLVVREHENEYLFVEYSHGISLERGEQGKVYKGEIKEMFSYISFIYSKLIPQITEEFEGTVVHDKQTSL